MRALILCLPSLVDILEKEVEQYSVIKEKIDKGVIVEGSIHDFYSIIFNSHIAQEVLLYIGSYDDNFVITENDINDVKGLLSKNKEMRISGSSEILYDFAPIILSKLSRFFNYKVDLNKPSYDYLIIEDKNSQENKYHIGVRLFRDLLKRDYRIHPHKQAINSSIAFALTFGFKGNILDPYTKDGAIVIERSLYQNNMLRKFQKNEIIEFSKRFIDDVNIKNIDHKKEEIFASTPFPQDLKKTKMNAKIAGTKEIKFSLSTTEQLDYKFTEKEISLIATIPPLLSKNNQTTKQKNEILLFFERSKEILLDNGILSLYVNSKTIDFIRENNIKFNERKIYNGFSIITIKKEAL